MQMICKDNQPNHAGWADFAILLYFFDISRE